MSDWHLYWPCVFFAFIGLGFWLGNFIHDQTQFDHFVLKSQLISRNCIFCELIIKTGLVQSGKVKGKVSFSIRS